MNASMAVGTKGDHELDVTEAPDNYTVTMSAAAIRPASFWISSSSSSTAMSCDAQDHFFKPTNQSSRSSPTLKAADRVKAPALLISSVGNMMMPRQGTPKARAITAWAAS
jgi:hypothetical protein